MTKEEFKDYALRTMFEEHLWKEGEADTFILSGYVYKLMKINIGYVVQRSAYYADYAGTIPFEDVTFESNAIFSSMNKAFKHIFEKRQIHIGQ